MKHAGRNGNRRGASSPPLFDFAFAGGVQAGWEYFPSAAGCCLKIKGNKGKGDTARRRPRITPAHPRACNPSAIASRPVIFSK